MELTSEEIEKIHYQKSSVTQRDFIDSLKKIGFEWKYFFTYEHKTMGTVDVSRFNTWSELLAHMFNSGQIKKMHEIQNVLGL